MEEYITHSRMKPWPGRRLANKLAPGSLIAFTGGLGAGKTAFCMGIAEGLGCTGSCFQPNLCHCQTTTVARGPLPILICTASIPKWIFLPPVFMITWIWALWLRRNGAKTAPTCWRWKTRFILTLTGWMKPPARLPSPGLGLDATPFWKGRTDPESVTPPLIRRAKLPPSL